MLGLGGWHVSMFLSPQRFSNFTKRALPATVKITEQKRSDVAFVA